MSWGNKITQQGQLYGVRELTLEKGLHSQRPGIFHGKQKKKKDHSVYSFIFKLIKKLLTSSPTEKEVELLHGFRRFYRDRGCLTPKQVSTLQTIKKQIESRATKNNSPVILRKKI